METCWIKLPDGRVLIEGEDFLLNPRGFYPKKSIPIVEFANAEFSPEFEKRFNGIGREDR